MEKNNFYWNYKMPVVSSYEASQTDWNQTLVTAINLVIAQFDDDNVTITIDGKLLPLFETLELYDQERSTMLFNNYKVKVSDGLNDIIKITNEKGFIYELPVLNYLS